MEIDVRPGAGAEQDVVPVDRQRAVEPVLHHAVCDADAADDGVDLQVHLDVVPIALVARPGRRLKEHLRGRQLFVVVPGRHVEARRHHARFHDAVAAGDGPVLGDAHQIDRGHAETRVDRLVVLQVEAWHAAVLVVVLDVGGEPVVGRAVPIAVEITHHQEFMRVVRVTRAHPVAAVLHPVAHIQRGGRREQMSRGAARDGRRRSGGEVQFRGAQAARQVLRGRRHHAGVVVPAARGERVVLERLLKQQGPGWRGSPVGLDWREGAIPRRAGDSQGGQGCHGHFMKHGQALRQLVFERHRSILS